ncbi:MAG TPA: hypothetical protein PLH14_06555, partial [Sphaerochaeta sp.]|nr:hypothetical protein [Sphaerochaeta sp.]
IGSILTLTLAYFARLTHAFRNTSGSIVKRIDQALLFTANEADEEASSTTAARPVHTPIVVLLATLVVAVSLMSRVLQ